MTKHPSIMNTGDADRLVFHPVETAPRSAGYDYPGDYAQRFDGIGPGSDEPADIEPVTDPAGNLWLCRTDEDGNYTDCIPWP